MSKYRIEVWDSGYDDWPRAARVWRWDEDEQEYYEIDPPDDVRDAIYRLPDGLDDGG